ncbi:unnamed protein product [Owenia fusiformis]|uniref:Uncharacterized protein n=1 Tax=Owenia fusiformis TaxID=6347 RepID=A0A8J1U979_OWEFU|nr:unnamed protein product [Owenia fusiformis]
MLLRIASHPSTQRLIVNRPGHHLVNIIQRRILHRIPDYKKLPNLPKHTVLKDGTNVLVDSATEKQIGDIYTQFHGAMHRGQGYGHDDFLSLDHFKEKHSRGQIFSLVDQDADRLIGGITIYPSRLSRASNPVLAGSNFIVTQEYRGRGCIKLLNRLYSELADEIGYEGCLGEIHVNNAPVIKACRDNPIWELIERLPKTSYVKDYGWIDSVIVYCDLTNKSNTH